MHATAKDLRFHSKELLDAVSRGEEVIITYRGKELAKLIPIETQSNRVKDDSHELFGIWKENDAAENVDAYVRELRKARY